MRILLSILLWSVFTVSLSQRLRYKDLAPALDTVSEGQQMSMLREYLAEDENHPNANYRLAMLHYHIYRHADPLLEFKKAMAHARESELRVIRARLLVTPQEVRSNNEYYAPFFKTFDAKGKPYVDSPVVIEQMNHAYDSARKFQEKMPPIFRSFTRSVSLYDKAVKLFAGINTEYRTLEDIYMLYNTAMDMKLGELKQAYDSSLLYFKQYQDLIADYPLEGYNQKFHIMPIRVYRMDGLITRLNFLSSDIEFWDYGTWVDGVRKKYSEEIAGIKEKIEKHETRLTSSVHNLESGGEVSEIEKVSKDLTFQLNNYDRNSLALALLEYKAYKQEWLRRLKSIARDTTIDSKLGLYSRLIQHNRVSDTLLTHIRSALSPLNLRKHQPYIEKHYGGAPGLDKYVRDENQWINKTFGEYQEILKENLLAYKPTQDSPGKFVKVAGFNVPLFIETKTISEMPPSTITTARIARNADGSAYVAGVHKMNKKTNFNAVGFVVRLNPDGKVAWMKELNFSPDSLPALDAANFVGDLVATQEGCALIITSMRAAPPAVSNNFVFINEKGDMKNFTVKETSMARKLIYQEGSNSFVMVFKGSEERQQHQSVENISITSMNVLGDILWHQDISLAGALEDVITVRDGYIVAGNFTSLKNESGKEIRTKVAEGQSNPFLIKLGLRGDIVKIQPVVSSRSIYIDKVVKVNDGSINLIGYESAFPDISDAGAVKGNLMHMMTNFELKSICANF